LLNSNQTILPTSIKLSGPDNQPLYSLGIANLYIKIDNDKFEIKAHVIKDLSSSIILGNDFLIKNNAIINFNSKKITLNNTTTTKLNAIKTNTINKINASELINNKCNIKEIEGNIFDSPVDFAIAHCISSDFRMSKGIAREICQRYNVRNKLPPVTTYVGDTITTKHGSRTIFHLITKKFFFDKPTYTDIRIAIEKLKTEAIKNNQFKIALPIIASGLGGRNWPIIKQIIYSEFLDCNIEIFIYHFNKNNITQNWKTNEHNEVIQNIHNHYQNKNNNTNTRFNYEIPNDNSSVKDKFAKYKPGENVPSDGNCGLYALCNALNDNKTNKITSISEILEIFGLDDLPNYWWSDEELASIADYYNFDTYIYNDTDNTGIVYGNGNRPYIILYNIKKNTHWIPGTISNNKSIKIPKGFIRITNITSLISIMTKIKKRI